MELHLDGVSFLNDRLEKMQEGRNNSCLKTHLWNRIAVIFQTVFSLAYCLILQTFRALSSLIGGILTLDGHKIGDAVLDVVSIVVQVLVIPIIGLISFFEKNPGSYGSTMSSKILEKHGKIKDHDNSCCKTARKIVIYLIRGIFAFPVGILNGIVKSFSAFFAADFSLFKNGIASIRDGIISPIFGLVYGCLEKRDPIRRVLRLSK